MFKTKFRYETIVRGKILLEKYSFNLITKIKEIKCEMQLDTGGAFTFLTDKFIRKYGLFKREINSYKKYDPKVTYDGYYSHIKKSIPIKIEGLGNFIIPKCYIEMVKTTREWKKKKMKELYKSRLPFAGYLGCDIFACKIFEINYKKELILVYHSLKELLSLNDRIDFHPLSIYLNTLILPYTINKLRGQAIFDTGSCNYTVWFENSVFGKLFKTKRSNLSYKDIIRPDFIARMYEYNKRINLSIGKLKINKEIPIYTPSKSFNDYVFRNYLPYNAILGNALFFDKRIIFDTINKRFAILEG